MEIGKFFTFTEEFPVANSIPLRFGRRQHLIEYFLISWKIKLRVGNTEWLLVSEKPKTKIIFSRLRG
jgi:hypothetical protein